MENLGDIDRQTIAGAISTGTHGTGAQLRNISAQVEGIELVLGRRQRPRARAPRPTPSCCGRRGSGSARWARSRAVTLRCVPAFTLRPGRRAARRARRCSTPSHERADANDHFELFTFPYADSALVLERNRTDEPPRPRGRAAAYLNDVVLENWALEALSATGKALPRGDPGALAARRRGSPPAAARPTAATGSSPTSAASASPRWSTACRASTGPEAARRVIEWVRANRYPVFFPIEMRVAAGDDALLSPSHERDTAYIAVHQYRGMEWRPYFEAVEEIMDAYGGRPHWGKRHFQTAATLAAALPALGRVPGAPATSSTPAASSPTSTPTRVLGP